MSESNTISSYLKNLSKYKLLDKSEIPTLISKAQQGDEKAREKLVLSNLKFVINYAKRYKHRGIPLEDLISAGIEGLIKGIDKYDLNKGNVFLTYAGWWVKQCIHNAIYNESSEIRIPVSQKLLIIRIMDETSKYVQKYSKNPSVEELSELTGIEISQVQYLAQFANKMLSVDESVGDDENNQLCDVIPDNSPSLDEQINKKLILEKLEKMLSILPEREYDLISMMFGIDMDPVKTSVIADMFGVSSERIRQMKETALGRLKKKFNKQLEDLL
jgi:RNA polymerase primary sigma factor